MSPMFPLWAAKREPLRETNYAACSAVLTVKKQKNAKERKKEEGKKEGRKKEVKKNKRCAEKRVAKSGNVERGVVNASVPVV